MSLRLSTALLSALSAPCYAALYALRLRRPDPWRRTLGLGLRGEGTKFALSAFGVRCQAEESDEALAARFADWLAQATAASPRLALRHGASLAVRVARVQADCALLEFEPNGILRSLHPLSPDLQQLELISTLQTIHRETLTLPEGERAALLQQLFQDHVQEAGAPLDLAQRLADCVGLSFDRSFSDRFVPPPFHWRRGLPGAGLDFVLRRLPGAAEFDVWMLVQHTLDDGAPRQELLSRLEGDWGTQSPEFPADRGIAPGLPTLCFAPGDRTIHLARDFVDLSSLQAWARARQAPVVAAMTWWLAREPEFEGRRFGVAVDVPASDGFARAVDLIGVRPADFPEFADFAARFSRLAAEARQRRGPTWRAMRNASFLPAALAAEWMAHKQDLAEATFGTVGVTMLRDARVFVAPMADFGWRDGFLALGSTALPTAGGGRVTSVTMKAEQSETCERLAAVRRAARQCRDAGG